MRVYLTFDVEIWCNDWSQLDQRFPQAFQRYVYGRSKHGDYALPKTLEILNRHGLQGVFFVEPLFAARFGLEHLHTVTNLIRSAGQDVQLHLHTEWVDELPQAPIANHHIKRQHLSHYTLEEQSTLIGYGAGLLEQVGAPRPLAFRAGSFACNRDSFRALKANGILLDSSLNACAAVSAPDLRDMHVHDAPAWIEGVCSTPIAVFKDGLGKLRSAQVNGSGFSELSQAMESAQAQGASDFVIVSHNFEMLKPGACEPDPIVVKRFEQLCAYLGNCRADLPTSRYVTAPDSCVGAHRTKPRQAQVRPWATLTRYAEQALRRL